MIKFKVLVSIHALLTECDWCGQNVGGTGFRFNPRTPYGVRQNLFPQERIRLDVSIHALLTECDHFRNIPIGSAFRFNPRTPYGVRPSIASTPPPRKKFQSTHSLRSATIKVEHTTPDKPVSIHALLTECDFGRLRRLFQSRRFNPRTPYGVRLCPMKKTDDGKYVSIHALLTECDATSRRPDLRRLRFNPRTPYGVRPAKSAPVRLAPVFQSTHSLRSATGFRQGVLRFFTVSIHALLTECDFREPIKNRSCPSFNPRTPYGVRPTTPGPAGTSLKFQSTHSLRSATHLRHYLGLF